VIETDVCEKTLFLKIVIANYYDFINRIRLILIPKKIFEDLILFLSEI